MPNNHKPAKRKRKSTPILFADIQLYRSIQKFWPKVEDQRSETWTAQTDKRRQLFDGIREILPNEYKNSWTDDQICVAWGKYGRSYVGDAKTGKRRPQTIRLILDIADIHGEKCFLSGVGDIQCNTEVAYLPIIPVPPKQKTVKKETGNKDPESPSPTKIKVPTIKDHLGCGGKSIPVNHVLVCKLHHNKARSLSLVGYLLKLQSSMTDEST